jgi:hypothetical protein
MWACLYLVWNMYGRTTNEENRKLFRQGAVLLVAAISVWLFDSNFCFVYQYVPNPQLHAFWHVLVSYVSKGQAKRQTCPQPTLHTHTVETNTKNNNNIFLFFWPQCQMSTSLHYFYVACAWASNLSPGAKHIQYLFGIVPYLCVSGQPNLNHEKKSLKNKAT